MKTRFVLSMLAVGALLATQGLVGCGSDKTGITTSTGGARSTGGVQSNGGTVSTGGSRATGGSTAVGGTTGAGGSTVPRDAGRDLVTNRDTAGTDTAGRDTAGRDTAQACGARGEACCAPNDSCDNGLTCQGGRNPTCEAPAVDGGNRDTARRDTAAACGARGEACCTPGESCDNGLTCQGPANDRTCDRQAVDGGNRDTFIRRDTAAEDAPPCGGLDQECCAPNDTCDNGLTCQGNRNPTCREAPADGGGRNRG